MTQPPQALIDTGNPLLAPVPVQMDAGTLLEPGGRQVVIFTLRSATTTMSPILDVKTFRSWLKILNALDSTLSESGLIVAGNGQVTPP